MKRAILIAMAVLNALAIYPLTVYKDGGVDYVTATYDSVVFLGKNEEVLHGNFSVSPTQQVNFMSGNVVCENSAWWFESEQWKEGSKFYWSGNLNPYGLSECSDSYWTGGDDRKIYAYYNDDYVNHSGGFWIPTSTGYSFVDWGEKFDDGWYTMSRQEWWHLLYGRDNAENLFSYATVCGVKGLLLLPDDFVNPGVPFYPLESDYSVNDYGLEDWKVLEKAGAVFLPEAQCWLSDGDFIYSSGVANLSILFPDTLRSDINVFHDDSIDRGYDCDEWDELRKNELEDISEYYGAEMICKHRNLLLLKSTISEYYPAPTLEKTYVRLVRPSGYLSDTEKPVIHTLSKSEDLGHDPVAKEPKFIAKDNCDRSVEVKVTTSGVEKVGEGKRQTWVATAVDAAGNVADEVKITYSWTGELSFLAQEFSVSPSKKVLFSPGDLVADLDEEHNPANYRFSSLPLKFFYENDRERFYYASGDYDRGWTYLVYMGKFTEYGEQMGDGWHTLSQKEWDYLYSGRENAENLIRSVTISPDTILKVMGDPYKQVANLYNFSIEGLDYDLSDLYWIDFMDWLDNSGNFSYNGKTSNNNKYLIVLPDDCPSDFRTIASETVADLKKLIEFGAVFIPSWNYSYCYMKTMPMGSAWCPFLVRLVWGEK
jgi:hypothetical protein